MPCTSNYQTTNLPSVDVSHYLHQLEIVRHRTFTFILSSYYCDISTLPGGIEGCREKESLPFVKLIDNFDAMYQAVANDDTVFTFLTNKDAPKYKLVRVDLREPNTWTEIIPQSENDVLDSAVAVNGNQLVVSYMSDCKHVLQLRDLQSGSLLHNLPISIGSVDDVSARRKDSLFFIAFTSFLTPGTIYQCDLKSGVPDLKIFREIVVPGFDQTEFQVSQVCFFESFTIINP